MSITDELLESIAKKCWHVLDADGYYELLAIADRIDEQHRKALENANELREELDYCLKMAPECDGCEAMFDCDECLRADSSQKERKRLYYENEQLRELVHELLTDPDAWDYDYFKYRMRELGIEK